MQRWMVAGTAILCYFVFSSSLSLGIAAVMAARQLFWKSKEAEPAADWSTFALFAMLLLALAGLANIDAPRPEQLGITPPAVR